MPIDERLLSLFSLQKCLPLFLYQPSLSRFAHSLERVIAPRDEVKDTTLLVLEGARDVNGGKRKKSRGRATRSLTHTHMRGADGGKGVY